MPVNKIEMYDADNMEGLLRHDGISENVKVELRKYKKRHINGNQVQIQYDFSESVRAFGKGRIYPQPFLGLATFPRDIRAALAAKYYDEIDMVNSQPTLLVQVATNEGVMCNALKNYVENRDSVLEAIKSKYRLTRDEAKTVCIKVLFGGYSDFHPLLPKIKNELETLSQVILSKYPEFLNIAKKSKENKEFKTSSNLPACALAQYIQHLETSIFLKIESFLTEKGYSVDVLQHDGGDVRKKEGQSISADILKEAENVVYSSTGYSIQLTVKPLVCPFDFTSNNNDTIVPSNILINDSFAAKKFVELVGDRLRKVGSELYVLGEDSIWETGEDSIRVLIREFESQLIWKQISPAGFPIVFDYGGNVSNIAKLIVQLNVWAKPGLLPLQFAYKLVGEIEDHSEKVEMFKELLHLTCGKDATLTDYVTKWISHILQQPYDLPGVMLILSGSKGVGKDTVFRFLIENVFGKYTSINYTQNDQFFEKHDVGRKGMLLSKLEEADRKQCMAHSSDIKAMVTGTTATFNNKNGKIVTVPNYTRHIFTTNKGNPVDFSSGERRFVILPCSADKKGDTAYWDRIYDVLFTPQAGKAVAEYLLSIDLSSFNVRKLPINSYQEAVIEAEMTPEQRFIEEWEGEKIPAADFYNNYISFCTTNGFLYASNNTSFGKMLLPFIRDGLLRKIRTNQGVVYEKV